MPRYRQTNLRGYARRSIRSNPLPVARRVRGSTPTALAVEALPLSQSTPENQISRVSSICRNPKLTYHFERTLMQRLGFDSRDGFTLANGLSPLGPGLAISFQLGQAKWWGSGGVNSQITVPSYTEFSNLFDEWKIDYIKIKMIYTSNVSNGSNVNPGYATYFCPTIQMAVDTTDDVPPTSSNDLLQYQNLQTRCFDSNGPQLIQFKPKAVTATEAGNVLATGYATNYGGWLSTTSAGTDWMGLKIFADLGGTSVTTHLGDFVFYVTYGLKFRGPK
ncbi:Cap [Chicken proventriculitis-associated circular virus 18]|nr:Cap [Chicken proventriculitis-associated circular virus 18]